MMNLHMRLSSALDIPYSNYGPLCLGLNELIRVLMLNEVALQNSYEVVL